MPVKRKFQSSNCGNPTPNPEACLVSMPWGRRAGKGSSSRVACYAGTSQEVRLRRQIYARSVYPGTKYMVPGTTLSPNIITTYTSIFNNTVTIFRIIGPHREEQERVLARDAGKRAHQSS